MLTYLTSEQEHGETTLLPPQNIGWAYKTRFWPLDREACPGLARKHLAVLSTLVLPLLLQPRRPHIQDGGIWG